MTKVIMTCFAGRQNNLEILFRYVDTLISKNLVHEFHLWNFTRDKNDEQWLKSYLKNPNTFAVKNYKYEHLPGKPKMELGKPLEVFFCALRDVHVLISDPDTDNVLFEVVLGGWSNKKSVLRHSKQGPSLIETSKTIPNTSDGMNLLSLLVKDGIFTVQVAGIEYFSTPINTKKDTFDVKVAGWDSTVEWSITKPSLQQNGNKILMRVNNKKSWLEYYKYYTKERYPDAILIKCDDDIAFIDTNQFASFIEKRKNNTSYLLAFPSIINNGVCAYYQQKQGLIPETLDIFPYDTTCGKLWKDGKLCQKLHNYFIDHHEQFLTNSKVLPIKEHPIGDRLSINFFAILSKDFHILQQIGGDDEKELSVRMPLVHKRHNYVDQSFVVSHLAFFKQRATGLKEDVVLKLYAELADEVLGTKK